MPWDHINNVINRSLPLKQPSKTASSHSSICINSRHRSPGLRKPHLLPSCFYLSLRCISCRDCKVRKAGKLFVPLRLPNSDQEIKPRASPRAPAPQCGIRWGGEYAQCACLGRHGFFSPVVEMDTGEGGSWDCFSNYFKQTSIPASQPQNTLRTWPRFFWPFQWTSQQTAPKHCFSLFWLLKSQTTLQWFCCCSSAVNEIPAISFSTPKVNLLSF